jgi:tetratricopeptide (TPR) repeat protein
VTRLILLALVLCAACAPSLPRVYRTSRAAAVRAYAHGRYDEAARHWHHAAEASDRARDRDHALYRAAASHLRAREEAPARALLERLSRSGSENGARADYDLALLDLAHGKNAAARDRLERLVRTRPDAAIAPSALKRLLGLLERSADERGMLATVGRLRAALARSELDERLGYAEARMLDEFDEHAAALAAYLELARRHPYPDGVYFDDALYRAALLERKLGRPRVALEHLTRLLAMRETARIAGSYERARYDQARFLMGELYRDELGELELARRSFLELYGEHATSRLRDDALWQAALIDFRAGDAPRGCNLLSRLVVEQPRSRYAACAPLACPKLKVAGARCHGYVARELERRPLR